MQLKVLNMKTIWELQGEFLVQQKLSCLMGSDNGPSSEAMVYVTAVSEMVIMVSRGT